MQEAGSFFTVFFVGEPMVRAIDPASEITGVVSSAGSAEQLTAKAATKPVVQKRSKKKGLTKRLIIWAILAAVIAVPVAWWFLLKPSDSQTNEFGIQRPGGYSVDIKPRDGAVHYFLVGPNGALLQKNEIFDDWKAMTQKYGQDIKHVSIGGTSLDDRLTFTQPMMMQLMENLGKLPNLQGMTVGLKFGGPDDSGVRSVFIQHLKNFSRLTFLDIRGLPNPFDGQRKDENAFAPALESLPLLKGSTGAERFAIATGLATTYPYLKTQLRTITYDYHSSSGMPFPSEVSDMIAGYTDDLYGVVSKLVRPQPEIQLPLQ